MNYSILISQLINAEKYNDPMTEVELVGVLKECKRSAPGEIVLCFEIPEKVNQSVLVVLRDIYNRIFITGSYPDIWRRAIVLSFLKPGNLSSDVGSY